MQEIAAWISRTGMVFEFIAFVFAAPEIFKDEQLEKFIDKLLVPLSMLAMTLPFATVGMFFYTLENVQFTFAFTLFATISTLLIIGTIVYIPYNMIFKSADDYVKGISPRRKYLYYGAFLFTLATILQIGASFWT